MECNIYKIVLVPTKNKPNISGDLVDLIVYNVIDVGLEEGDSVYIYYNATYLLSQICKFIIILYDNVIYMNIEYVDIW